MRVLLPLLLFTGLFLSAVAQPAPNTTDPAIRWLDPTTTDLYTIPYRETTSVEFRYLNAGNEPLLIDNIRTSCGCTAAEWSREPLPPDSTGVIRIEYDARERGYFRKQIKVYFHGQRRAERLYVEGEVE